MDLQIKIEEFEKSVDEDTGAILFYKRGFKGIPDKVIHGEGFNFEVKGREVVLLDIYNPRLLLSKLVKETLETAP
jgi:hypothetical protein